MEQQSSKIKTGLLFGLLAGAVYMVLLTVRYQFSKTSVQLFPHYIAGYLIFIGILFLAAYTRRKQLGGYASLRTLFGTLFIVVLIAELCFSLFNIIYLRTIDPGYLDRLGQNTLEWMHRTHVDQKQIELFEEAMQGQRQTGFGTLALGLAQSVIVDSIVGFFVAFIMKRNPAA